MRVGPEEEHELITSTTAILSVPDSLALHT